LGTEKRLMSQAGHRATIAPLPAGIERPLWSVMIPTFNCARYLSATLRSVLAHDPGPATMQIEVVDDYSTRDDPHAVVAEVGRERVGFYRQSRNVGITENFATCLRRSRGRLVHLLHGDDYVIDDFYAKMQRAFAVAPAIGAAFCRHMFVDAEGHTLSLSALEQRDSGVLEKSLERLAVEQRIMTPSIVVKRDVYEQLGAFDDRLPCSEDWEMWVRIAAHYPIWYEIDPLAAYRMHQDSNTGRHTDTARDMRYTRAAIDIFKAYLPPAIAKDLTRQARETYALSAIDAARSMLARHDFSGASRQLREALLFNRSTRVIGRALRSLLWS
jgi:glycosyltransferase involved in cell wall biosynthesis